MKAVFAAMAASVLMFSGLATAAEYVTEPSHGQEVHMLSGDIKIGIGSGGIEAQDTSYTAVSDLYIGSQ